MKRADEQEKIFLEISRKHVAGRGSKTAIEGEFRFATWCERCRGKVELVQADKSVFKNAVAESVKITNVRGIQNSLSGDERRLNCFASAFQKSFL